MMIAALRSAPLVHVNADWTDYGGVGSEIGLSSHQRGPYRVRRRPTARVTPFGEASDGDSQPLCAVISSKASRGHPSESTMTPLCR